MDELIHIVVIGLQSHRQVTPTSPPPRSFSPQSAPPPAERHPVIPSNKALLSKMLGIAPYYALGGTLQLSGSKPSIEFGNPDNPTCKLYSSCGGPNATVTFLEPKRTSVRAHLHVCCLTLKPWTELGCVASVRSHPSFDITHIPQGVPATCTGSSLTQPCVSVNPNYPSLFHCDWVFDATTKMRIGPLAASSAKEVDADGSEKEIQTGLVEPIGRIGHAGSEGACSHPSLSYFLSHNNVSRSLQRNCRPDDLSRLPHAAEGAL